jgi:hypothetical protein
LIFIIELNDFIYFHSTVNPRMLSHGVTQKLKTLAVCCSAILRTRSLNFFQFGWFLTFKKKSVYGKYSNWLKFYLFWTRFKKKHKWNSTIPSLLFSGFTFAYLFSHCASSCCRWHHPVVAGTTITVRFKIRIVRPRIWSCEVCNRPQQSKSLLSWLHLVASAYHFGQHNSQHLKLNSGKVSNNQTEYRPCINGPARYFQLMRYYKPYIFVDLQK